MNITRYTTELFKTTLGCSLLLVTLLSPLNTKAQFSLLSRNEVEMKTITGLNPSGIKTGDMDNDGKMDLILCFEDNNTVQIFLNTSVADPKPDIRFSNPFQFIFSGGNAGEFIVGDLNRDGLPEILISNTSNAAFIVLQNNSTAGKLSFATAQFVDSPDKTGALSICDLDADGFADVIAACRDQVIIYRNTCSAKAGAIEFESSISLSVFGIIHDLKCADIDGDGSADIIAGTQNGISVIRNQTTYGAHTLSFAKATTQNTDRSVLTLDIGDIDNDFKPDIVTSNWPNGDISILPNQSQNGNIVFSQAIFMEAGSPQGIVLGDFDQDGKFDIASSSGSGMQITQIFRNISAGEGDFSFAEAQNFDAFSKEMIVNDFDRDGGEDIIGFNTDRNSITLLLHSKVNISDVQPELNVYCGEDGNILMDWEVSVQNKGYVYEIEKTFEGKNFNSITTLTDGEEIAGRLNFSYSDTNASANISYYRLKILNPNGNLSYSDLKSTQPCFDVLTGFVCSYPNPVDRVMNFSFSITGTMVMHYAIMDMNMNTQLEKTENVTPGTRTYSLDIMQLQKGSYIFVVKFGNLPPRVCRFEKL